MKSPYSDKINHLRRTSGLSGLATLIFSLITVGLIFLPGTYFLFGLIPLIISTLIGLNASFTAEVYERQEIDWKINQKLDALKAYYLQEKERMNQKE